MRRTLALRQGVIKSELSMHGVPSMHASSWVKNAVEVIVPGTEGRGERGGCRHDQVGQPEDIGLQALISTRQAWGT